MATAERIFHLRPEGERAFGFAQARRSGNTLYVSGVLSVDDRFEPQGAGDMRAQVKNVYDTIETTLRAFGIGLANVVREGIFVTDMAAFLEANAIRVQRYEGHPLPTATAVEVRRLAFEPCMVEIELMAEL